MALPLEQLHTSWSSKKTPMSKQEQPDMYDVSRERTDACHWKRSNSHNIKQSIGRLWQGMFKRPHVASDRAMQ